MARKILLADDSVTAQNMGRKILADAGYEVITVNNGSAALKKVSEAKPDVIVLDVYMPGYSGLEVCQRLKEVNETARIPVLLTVGKLEPFKPEEAKRARADAFIVKPFEASELLSALSKLEDKIVPRPEPHKPGRFARAIAAVEEGRYDKSMAVEEDEGWKNRIKFPPAKKEKPAEEKELDTDQFYNPMNKDLRTTVDHSALRRPDLPRQDAARVDLGALASQGLPKDVTPEEIAALAAAAAQIKGTAAEKTEPEKQAETKTAEERPAESRTTEERVPEIPAAPSPVSASVAEPVAAQSVAQAPSTPPIETAEKIETKPEQPAAEIPQEAVAAAPITEAQKEKTAAPADKAAETAPDFKPPVISSPAFADLTGAIVALPLGTYVSLAPGPGVSGNGSNSHSPEPEKEPMTMAAAAGTNVAHSESRWMAVPVALLPEEAALSLEQEMQKTYAAFAAADAGRATASPASESPAVAVAELPAVVPSPETPAPATEGFMPEVARTMSNVASVAAEAIKAAVKEFEHVATSLVESKPEVKLEPEAAPQAVEPEAQKAIEAAAKTEAKVEEAEIEKSAEAEREKRIPQSTLEAAPPEAEPEKKQLAEQKQEPEVQRQKEHKREFERKQEVPQPEMETVAVAPSSAEISKSTKEDEKEAPVPASEVPEPVSASKTTPQITEGSEEDEPTSGGVEDMVKKEQEAAAAWASWRRIRETGKGPAPETSKEAALEKDEAAMAVAAGAEKAPQEHAAEGDGESDEIASIVDSVLADMRPKIVEEISRKMGKKKK